VALIKNLMINFRNQHFFMINRVIKRVDFQAQP